MDIGKFTILFISEIINTMPYNLLAYVPFLKNLHIKVGLTAAIVGITNVIQAVVYAYCDANNLNGYASNYIFAAVYFLLFFVIVNADKWKIVFMYILTFGYTLATRGLILYTEACLFYDPNMTFNSLRTCVIAVIVLAVSMPPMIIFLRVTKERVYSTDAPSLWRVIWMPLAVTTVIVLMYTADISPDNVRQVRFLASRVLLILAMFVVYFVLLRTLDVVRQEAATAEKAIQQENLLMLQRSQYSQMTRHIEETRRARHDLKHHMKVINDYLSSGNEDALRKYMEVYEESVPIDTGRIYCENYAVNAIVSYYAEEANEACIDFVTEMHMPYDLPIGEPDVCSVLGNLVENAFKACREVADRKAAFIRVLASCEGHVITIAVDNTCLDEPVVKDGKYISTYDDGQGIGITSVKAMADKYDGHTSFEYSDEVFCASVLLRGEVPAR